MTGATSIDALLRAGVTHAKLSFIGAQEKPVLTLLWLTGFAALPPRSRDNLRASRTDADVMAVFTRAQPAAIHDNDALPGMRAFAVSPDEMARMVHAIAPLSAVAAGPHPLLSLTLVAGGGAAEYRIDFERAADWYRALIAGVALANSVARMALERHALDAGVFRRPGS